MEKLNIIENIERKLLPQGCFFSDEQRLVIFSEGNANIIAGPGSGKTTVLIAKFVYLIKKSVDANKGICVITHTNVAVDEIKTQLKKVGITQIDYPNFIGTIHEFFNYFFSYKAYQELFPDKIPTLLEEDDYEEKFKKKFEKYRTDRYRGAIPVAKMKESFLSFTQSKIELISNCHYSNKQIVLDSLLDLISNGEIRHNDTLSLANWYIDKNLQLIRQAFSSRFSWMILDEAQDTSKFQFELLNKVVNLDEMNYQRFGDPYQSLYNMYDQNVEDAWVPNNEENVFHPLELSNSTRFGNSIANILKTTCIEEYNSFKGNPQMVSFKPHLLIYKNKRDVIPAYLTLIQKFYSSYKDFNESKKKIAIVGAEHNHLKQYKVEYEKPKSIKVRTEGIMKLLYNVILKGMYLYLKSNNLVNENFSLKELIHKVNEEMVEVKAMLSVVFREIINNKGKYNEQSKQMLNNAYKEILTHLELEGETEYNLTTLLDYVFNESLVTFQTYASSVVSREEIITDEELFFGTVHAVKGETHKATLLIDSTITEFKFRENEASYNLVDLIIEYLTGDFIDYMSTGYDVGRQQATKKALKIAYVALSRPTHLACVAFDYNELGDNYDYILDKSTKFGWEVKVL